jgi:outer membrane protein assembly factor BamA
MASTTKHAHKLKWVFDSATGIVLRLSHVLLGGLLGITLPTVSAQNSRVAEIESARDQKAQMLQPDAPGGLERKLLYIKEGKLLERMAAGVAGFRVKMGGLVTGSGFALGPEYVRRDFAGGGLTLRSAAQSSFKGYQKYDLQLSQPPSERRPYFLGFYSAHRNYPGINYYGPGPESEKSSRSSFRYEDTEFHFAAGVQPTRRLNFGAAALYLLVNVGPGNDSRFASTDQVFTPALVVGLDEQTNFFRHSYFVQYDYRDSPGGPRAGGNYSAEYSRYLDQKHDSYSFQQLDLHLNQYIPFFNQRRVFALRGRSLLTFHEEGQAVPFYMQPHLGGSDDLRGFRPYRFYDNNSLVVNAEYRWETFSGLDAAVFADAGKVFAQHSRLNFHDLESSFGFGLRFNVLNKVFLRTDVGFSHEGFQVWVKFNNIFSESPVGSPDSLSVY